MKKRKINYAFSMILLFGFALALQNCQNDEENITQLKLEKTQTFNLKTVSFKEAKNLFIQKTETIKEKRTYSANKNNNPILEITPDWTSIRHEKMYGIEHVNLTLSNASINRDGTYESKIFFLDINNEKEAIIFTIFPRKIASDGKILDASFFYNKLDGEFIDGFKIEKGKLTKRYLLKSILNTQEAGFLMFFQGKEDDDDFWCDDGTGGVLDEVSLGTVSNSGGGISVGPTSSSTSVSLSYASINWYYLGNGGSTGMHSPSGGGTSAISGAGSLYTHIKETSENKEVDPNRDPLTGKCKYGYKMNPNTGKCEKEFIETLEQNEVDKNGENPLVFVNCQSFEYYKPPGATVTAAAVDNMTEKFYAIQIKNDGSTRFTETSINYNRVYFTMPSWKRNGQAANETASIVTTAKNATQAWYTLNPTATKYAVSEKFIQIMKIGMIAKGGQFSKVAPFYIKNAGEYQTSLLTSGDCD